MRFSEIPGNIENKKRLISSVKNERISPAQLWTGTEGSCQLAMAIAFSQYLNCENKTDEDSCGQCPPCLKICKLVHPDLHFVYPVNSTQSVTLARHPVSDHFSAEWQQAVVENPFLNVYDWLQKIGIENKQGNISTHESSSIIKKLSLKSYESSYKIMIIWMAEYLHLSASNKLLKIIEEPPDKTIFILITEDEDSLLATIKSRVHFQKMLKPTANEIDSYLTEHQNFMGESAAIIRLSDNNMREVMTLISEDFSYEHEDYFTTLMRMCYKKDLIGLVNWVEDVAKYGRENQKLFIKYSLNILRDCNMLAIGCESLVNLPDSVLDFAKKMSPYVSGETGVVIAAMFSKAGYAIERNGNPKILFMDLALKVIKEMSVKAAQLKTG